MPEQRDAGFEDVSLLPCAAPELAFSEVDTSCDFLGKRLAAPVLINAMTGGHPELLEINRVLARTARCAGLAMAVGSQRAALEHREMCDTFAVVRRENPGGVILGNLNAGCTPVEAVAAVEMLAADALQLHLNAPQELAMIEGEVDFRGILGNIEKVKAGVGVPVIVKEVGFGLSREVVGRLRDAGVDYVDVGGWGGTNFIAIERMRGGRKLAEEMLSWGIPTVAALVEANAIWPGKVIVSGGIRTALDVAKSLAIGATLAGVARPFLVAFKSGPEAVAELVCRLKEGLRSIMFLAGARDIPALRTKPVVITGRTREWLRERGIQTWALAQRKNNG